MTKLVEDACSGSVTRVPCGRRPPEQDTGKDAYAVATALYAVAAAINRLADAVAKEVRS